MATDFSLYSHEAQDHAVYLARSLGVDLHLLHVFEPPYYSHTGVTPSIHPEVHQWLEEIRKTEQMKLNTLAEEVRSQGVKVYAVFKEGEPFLEILKAAEEIEADLIVMGTHGRTGLAHALMGSVAERVVRKATCPVFTVRAKVPEDMKG
jgi:glycine betaine transporter